MSTAVGHYIENTWSDEDLIEFKKAFLLKYLKIKKPERIGLESLNKKRNDLSIGERNFLQTTDLNKKYGDTDFVVQGAEQALGRKIAAPHLLATYPPTQKFFDEFANSKGLPEDKMRLMQSVTNTLRHEGYTSEKIHQLAANLPVVSNLFQEYFDPRDMYTRGQTFERYVAEQDGLLADQQRTLNTNDVISFDPLSKQTNITPFQLMPKVVQSYFNNFHDRRVRENFSTYVMTQRLNNLYYSLNMYKEVSAGLKADIDQITALLRLSAQGDQASMLKVDQHIRKLSLAYPTYINPTTLPNDALNILKQLVSSINAAYNATIDSVYSGDLHKPDEMIDTTLNKELPRFSREGYFGMWESKLNSVELSDEQKDTIRQFIHKNKHGITGDYKTYTPDLKSHLDLVHQLNKMRTAAQNPDMFNNFFDLNAAIGYTAEQLGAEGTKRILDANLKISAQSALANGKIADAVQYMNAIYHPNLDTRNMLDLAEKYDYNYKFYDSSNPLIADIWYGNDFLNQSTEKTIFDDFTNLKNVVSGFIARRKLTGQYPNPSELTTYEQARNSLKNALWEQIGKNPNNHVYKSMADSSVMYYSTDMFYRILSEPSTPYIQSLLMNQPVNNDNMMEAETIGDQSGMPTNQSPMQCEVPDYKPVDSSKMMEEAKKGGSIAKTFIKHLPNAIKTANIAKDAYDPDFYKSLNYRDMAKKAFKNNAVRWIMQVGQDVPTFLKSGNTQQMEFYQQNNRHQTMTQDTQTFETPIKPISQLQMPDFNKLNFIEYENAWDDNEQVHNDNVHHIGGLLTYAEKFYRHHKPEETLMSKLYQVPHAPHKVAEYKEVRGCGICGKHDDLHGYSSDDDDITCKSCIGQHGITSKRKNAMHKKHRHIKEGGGKHQELHNAIENNKLFEKIKSEKISNNWDDFVESYKGKSLDNMIKYWKSGYYMDRPFATGDISKMVYAIGKFLYDEEDVNDNFLDNLNSAVIKYLSSVDKTDSLKKEKLPSKFHTFSELKELVQTKPGVLKTLLLDLE